MAKETYSEVQNLDKKGIIKKIILIILVLGLAVGALCVIKTIRNKPVEVEETETVTPAMVPSAIKYYDPSQEKTYDTGADYIVLTDGSQRIRIDSSGNVYKVSETGQNIGSVTEEEKNAALKQAASIMQIDSQASLALAGLDATTTENKNTVEVEEKSMTNDEALRALLEEKGINYSDFVGQVYGMGSTLDDVYTMLWMYEDDDKVIDAIMQSETQTEEPVKKPVSVTVEKLGDTTTTETVSSTESSYEYPEWMQESDPTASMSALVETLSALSGSGTSTTTSNTNQAEKSAWLESQKSETVGNTGKITKYDLVAGTVIPITLVTGINTDLPGDIVGLVRQDIYDTLTGSEVLIPKGSRVMASYNSSVTYGQKSVQIAWTQLITPDGYIFTLPGFQGVTQEGYSGVSGKVNNHFWQVLGGAVLGSIINYGTGTAEGIISGAASSVGNEYIANATDAVAGTALETVQSVGTQYANKWANVQPTITIETGTQIQMLVNQTVNFKKN
jgi:type IV secretory pathway VirB10-like protein